MAPHDESNETFTISIPPSLGRALLKTVETSGCSMSQCVEKALQSFIQDERAVNAVYLSAPVNALLKGYYEENTLLGDLKKHGDFGLGTFNNLDGEMVMLDGIVYQLNADGKTYPVDDQVQTPFACVTFYTPHVVEEIETGMDFEAFNHLLNRMLPSDNMFYAVRVDGSFRHIKVWSVARKENYQPLEEDQKDRPYFEYRDIEGTLAGFYTPRFIRALNFPGFHMHFLTADRGRGGHLHECQTKRIRIGIQFVHRLKLDLPMTLDYLCAHLPR